MNRNGLIATGLVALALSGCVEHRTEYAPTTTARGVVSKQYVKPRKDAMVAPAVLFPIPVTHPAQYNLRVISPECTGTINDRDLFANFKDGEPVTVTYRLATDVTYLRADGHDDILESTPAGCEILRLGHVKR